MSNHPSFSHITVLDEEFTLADGIQMNIKYSLPANASVSSGSVLPPLIFIHGSFHAAWCWENFMPYFVRLGYPCISLNLRGTSKTHHKPSKSNLAGYEINKVKIGQHVDDVLYFLEYLNKRIVCKEKRAFDGTMRLFFDFVAQSAAPNEYIAPIIIAHSFGGLISMKLLERLPKQTTKPLLSSMALLCSMPPTGIAKMSLRALRRNPLKGWRITKGLAMKKAVSDPKLCRLLFFDQEMSNERIKKYMTHFQEDSKVSIDLHDLAKKLPILVTDDDGCSTCIQNGVLQYQALVVGSTKDYIVDSVAVKETANFMCITSVMVKGAVHDVMLAGCWCDVAKEIGLWLENIVRMAKSARHSQNDNRIS